ncbi:hypothetical protein QJS10_CPB17g00361 [Acorus calamus]|uniref:Myb/SANT-like domain-containing protein n=1 Tax=Acorus calamus TaxID=4465 RepID=A0AAV9CSC4_ACOCL|nr:hypothetical protein QJS10_CPB17g00361 [Acorus calamus]
MAMTLDMSHCKNRWKVLKQTFVLYQQLSNRTGWGWDDEMKMVVPGDAKEWDRLILLNDKYGVCREKPFLWFKEFSMLCGNSTSKGFHAISSNRDIDALDNESEGDSEEVNKMKIDALNLQTDPVEEFFNGGPSYEAMWGNKTPIEILDEGGPSARRKGKRSMGSTRSEEEDFTMMKKRTSSSSAKRNKTLSHVAYMDEFLELGRRRVDVAKELIEKDYEGNIPSNKQ